MIDPVLPTYAPRAAALRAGRGLMAVGGRRPALPRPRRGDRHLLAGPRAPRPDRGADAAGRRALARLQPLRDRAPARSGRAAGGRDVRGHRVPVQLGHRGLRARHQDGAALPPRAGRAAGDDRHLRGRVPRPIHRRHRRLGLGEDDAWLRPPDAGLRHAALGRPRRPARSPGRDGRRGAGRAHPGRGRHPRHARLLPQGPARAVRRGRRADGARRGAVRHGSHGPALRA